MVSGHYPSRSDRFTGTEVRMKGVLGNVGIRRYWSKDGAVCDFIGGEHKMVFQFLGFGRNSCLRPLGLLTGVVVTAMGLDSASQAGTVTFGSGANSFNMEFVTIGNPGNAADTTGTPAASGSVAYSYEMNKYEVSEGMIAKYNALNPSMQITMGSRGLNKPATSISWNEAARFVNWLNTSTGGFAAYKYVTNGVNDNISVWSASDTLDYDATNPFRSKRAAYVLPTYNEWYKAAFYNPTSGLYTRYPTGSDSAPTAVASGTAAGTVVYNQIGLQGVPADIDQAGGLSPYGVMGLAGNVQEWQESSTFTTLEEYNTNPGANRMARGGFWGTALTTSGIAQLGSNRNGSFAPGAEEVNRGFRVAVVTPTFGGGGGGGGGEVPEPTSMVIFGLGVLGMAYRGRQKVNA